MPQDRHDPRRTPRIGLRRGFILLALSIAIGLAVWLTSGSGQEERVGALGVDAATREGPETAASPVRLAGARPRPPEPDAAIGDSREVDPEAPDRDLDLDGIVVHEDGSAVPGALVVARARPGRRVSVLDSQASSRFVDGPSTRTTPAGVFRLRLRRGDKVDLVVSAAGFSTVESPDHLAGERVRVVMRPGVRLAVTVSDEAGTAIPATDLRLFRGPEDGDIAFEFHATTDAEGRTTFDGIPGPTQAWIEALPKELGSVPWVRVAIPPQGETAITIKLPAGRTITGCVVDAETHIPVAGAHVGIGWTLFRPVETGADGCYALRGWTGRGEALLHVVAAGYGRASRRVGTADVVDFALTRGDSVVGRLVGEDGRGVARVEVHAIAHSLEGAEERLSTRSGESGEDGRFRLDGLVHDLPHTLVALSEGRGRTLVDFSPATAVGGTIDLGDVILAEGRRVEGRLVDAEGAPIPRTLVRLIGANADRARRRDGVASIGDVFGAQERCWTDDLGRFRFRDVAPGTYSLSATPVGRPLVEARVEVVHGDVLDVILRAAPARSLRVRVIDSASSRVSGAAVTLTDSASGSWFGQARTDADGVASFDVPLSAARQVRVVVSPPPLSGRPALLFPTAALIETGATEATVVLSLAAAISGRVLDVDEQQVSGVAVVALRDGAVIARVFSNPDGGFELSVPQGSLVEVALGATVSRDGAISPSPLAGSAGLVSPGATGLVIRATRRTPR